MSSPAAPTNLGARDGAGAAAADSAGDADPGRAFLYSPASAAARQASAAPSPATQEQGRQASPAKNADSSSAGSAVLANFATLEESVQQITALLRDAAFVDDETLTAAQRQNSHDAEAILLHRRIMELEAELEGSLTEIAELRAKLSLEKMAKEELRRDYDTAMNNLSNNEVVFKMHYDELIAKTSRIEELERKVEELAGSA